MKTEQIFTAFDVTAHVQDVVPLNGGHINDTFRVITRETTQPDYVMQRINHHIFTDVDLLMHNILAVTRHIRQKLESRGMTDVDRRVLTFFPTHEGKYYYHDGENYWRLMQFIPDTMSRDTVNADNARSTGLAFGEFQDMLSDLPETLGETIPNFHNMEYRLWQLREAVGADAAGRVAKVRDLIDRIEQHADDMLLAERLHRSGKLPKRVCHCDTKVNNILFDANGEVLCVIDLDTVMPNYVFSDFGDFLRTAACTAPEDEPDLDRIHFDLNIFEAFASGYLQRARFLTDVEVRHLPFAASLFPYMQAVRFLTDYVASDTYYKTAYPEHNLVRAKAQFRLFECVEQARPQMNEIIDNEITRVKL